MANSAAAMAARLADIEQDVNNVTRAKTKYGRRGLRIVMLRRIAHKVAAYYAEFGARWLPGEGRRIVDLFTTHWILAPTADQLMFNDSHDSASVALDETVEKPILRNQDAIFTAVHMALAILVEGPREGPTPAVTRQSRATPEALLGPRAEVPAAPPNRQVELRVSPMLSALLFDLDRIDKHWDCFDPLDDAGTWQFFARVRYEAAMALTFVRPETDDVDAVVQSEARGRALTFEMRTRMESVLRWTVIAGRFWTDCRAMIVPSETLEPLRGRVRAALEQRMCEFHDEEYIDNLRAFMFEAYVRLADWDGVRLARQCIPMAFGNKEKGLSGIEALGTRHTRTIYTPLYDIVQHMQPHEIYARALPGRRDAIDEMLAELDPQRKARMEGGEASAGSTGAAAVETDEEERARPRATLPAGLRPIEEHLIIFTLLELLHQRFGIKGTDILLLQQDFCGHFMAQTHNAALRPFGAPFLRGYILYSPPDQIALYCHDALEWCAAWLRFAARGRDGAVAAWARTLIR